MSSKKKVYFSLSNEALAVVDRRAKSPNKRGDWLSAIILEYDAILADPATLAAASTVADLLKRLAERRQ